MITPFRICFVCTGNICRSPMAESVFRAHLAEDGLGGLVEVDSAGTGGWHEGEGADPRTVTVLRTHGYESTHTARQFHASWFGHLDLVIALDSGHLRALRRMAPTRQDAAKVHLLRSYATGTADASDITDRPDTIDVVDSLGSLDFLDSVDAMDELDVPDPYYGDLTDFEACLEMVESASEGLLTAVRTEVAARAVTPARVPEHDRDHHRAPALERPQGKEGA
ncbi:low molecular weight protein-tyrosine-phosphatase [Streptomyces sp. NPDC020742]|uniref:low molecular weight protein-tyrosine-phosphatase n=1 Tax=Streptomyces sp. NPDC020742 TaxID=3154897 RepID=UPI0033DE279A